MPCPQRSPGGYGPFDGNACAACQTAEVMDRCGAGKAGCADPFGAEPCSACKRIATLFGTRSGDDTFKAQRSARRAWLGGLQLSVVPLQKFYDGSSAPTPAQIDQKVALLRSQGDDMDWCPWVQIGNVFTAVAQGNNKGWRLLVADLFAADPKRRHFAVVTGRHGNTQGTLTQARADLHVDGVASAQHLTEDIAQKALLDAQCKAAGGWAQYPLFEMEPPYNFAINQIAREKTGCV